MKNKNKDKNILYFLIGSVLFMLCLAYASVPLYKIFCQKTGFGGTIQTAAYNNKNIINRKIKVIFISNVDKKLNWEFKPLQKSLQVKLGENALVYYLAKNNSNDNTIGMATYNVVPDAAGKYFNKIECFCFQEQVFSPQQDKEFPLLFFIDPDFDKDPLLKNVNEIVLSYTFFKFKK